MVNQELLKDILKFEKYIQSKEWKEIKEERLKKDNYLCVICKSNKRLICHHLIYKRLYKTTFRTF